MLRCTSHDMDDIDVDSIRYSVMEYNIYADGSCINNGTPDAMAGIGVWVDESPQDNVSECVPPSYNQTNQVAELLAIQRSVEIGRQASKTTIYSDSEYAVNSINKWYYKWKSNGWKTATNNTPKNLNIIRETRDAMDDAAAKGNVMSLVKVKGHSGIYGNEKANELAITAVQRENRAKVHHAVRVLDNSVNAWSPSSHVSTSAQGNSSVSYNHSITISSEADDTSYEPNDMGDHGIDDYIAELSIEPLNSSSRSSTEMHSEHDVGALVNQERDAVTAIDNAIRALEELRKCRNYIVGCIDAHQIA